jgi:hypothetical protein
VAMDAHAFGQEHAGWAGEHFSSLHGPAESLSEFVECARAVRPRQVTLVLLAGETIGRERSPVSVRPRPQGRFWRPARAA